MYSLEWKDYTVLVDGAPREKDVHYTIDYATGKIHFVSVPPAGEIVKARTSEDTEIGAGNSTTTDFYFTEHSLAGMDYTVLLNGVPQEEGVRGSGRGIVSGGVDPEEAERDEQYEGDKNAQVKIECLESGPSHPVVPPPGPFF